MKKWIRWSGLLSFLVLVALLLVVTHLFLDTWIKYGFEKFASKSIGAEVNVAHVKHSYAPLGLTFKKIQVTDPARPESNQVEIERVSAKLEFAPLLLNKFVINELTTDGVAFNTPRARPGKVYKDEVTSKDSGENDVNKKGFAENFDVELPSVKSILEKYPLQTREAVDTVKATYEGQEKGLREDYAALPDEERLKGYEQKIKAITEQEYSTANDVLQAREKLKSLKDELKREQEKVKSFQRSVAEASDSLAQDIQTLKSAPQEDFDKLKKLIAGDAAALTDMTELLFGEQTKKWLQRLLSAYELVVPLLQSSEEEKVKRERTEGRWIAFDETQALPNFLVRKAQVSLLLQGESVASTWRDITSEHDVLGRATTYNIAADNAQRWQSLLVDGNFWLAKSGLRAEQGWQLKSFKLPALPIEYENFISGEVEKALLNASGKLTVDKGLLDGKGLIDFVNMAIAATGENKTASIVAKALEELNQLQMQAKLSGKFDQPSFSLSSDLDSLLGDLVAQKAGKEVQGKLDELKSSLNGIASQELGTSESRLQDWEQWQAVADGKSESIEKMLQAEIQNALDKKKDKLEDELRKKLFK